jgi:NAD(P)-dependent dehydrogenase (short-subunit alcohol dehydrogenase family)
VAGRFAAEGAAVVLTGRRPGPLRATAAALGQRSPDSQVLAIPADAAEAADMAGVAQEAVARFGGVDILVANAGGPGLGTAADVTEDAWADSIRANMTTCLVSARACLPELIRRRGAVVVVSPIAGMAAAPESVGYVTAKQGLIGLARSMARDFGPRGVRVNTVCPGWVRTPMADEEMDQLAGLHGLDGRDAAYTLATAQVPLRRPAEPHRRPPTSTRASARPAWLGTGEWNFGAPPRAPDFHSSGHPSISTGISCITRMYRRVNEPLFPRAKVC